MWFPGSPASGEVVLPALTSLAMAAAGYSLFEFIVVPALQTVTFRDEEYGSYIGLSFEVSRARRPFGMTLRRWELVSSNDSGSASWPRESISDYTAHTTSHATRSWPSACASCRTMWHSRSASRRLLPAAFLFHLCHHLSEHPLWDDADFAWLSGERAWSVRLRGTDADCYVKWHRNRRTRSRALSSALPGHRHYGL